MKKPNTKYEVKVGDKFETVKVAKIMPSGWLHWEDRDGCTGLSRPGNWREANSKNPDRSGVSSTAPTKGRDRSN